MKRLLVVLIFLAAGLAQQPSKAPAAPKTTYIRAGRVFDGTGDKVRENVVIVVRGDRIQTVEAAGAASIPKDATVIDLSRATVLPGLIDCHTHLVVAIGAKSKMRVAVNQAGQHRGSRKIDDRCA